jgi:hypothetical protein
VCVPRIGMGWQVGRVSRYRFASSKSLVDHVDDHVADTIGVAGSVVKGAAGLSIQAAAAVGAASRVVVEHVGSAVASVVPETGMDVPEGVRSAAAAVSGAVHVGQDVLSGVAGAAGSVGRAAGATARAAFESAFGDTLGSGPSWRSVDAAKAATEDAGGIASQFFETFQRESSATMEAAREQARRVLERAAGPNTAAAADELLRAAQKTAELASTTPGGVVKEAAKTAAKEAAKGVVESKD